MGYIIAVNGELHEISYTNDGWVNLDCKPIVLLFNLNENIHKVLLKLFDSVKYNIPFH